MHLDDALGNAVVRISFQLSLSLLNRTQAARCAASAFLLKSFSQAGVMIGSGNRLFTRKEEGSPEPVLVEVTAR